MWKIVETGSVDKISGFSPNTNEFIEYCNSLGVSVPGIEILNFKINHTFLVESLVSFEALADFINTNKSFLHRVFPDQMQFLLVTMGANGCLLLSRTEQSPQVQITTILAPTKKAIISASGSGDW